MRSGCKRVVITEVRIKLNMSQDNNLLAFCSITLGNAFVIRDLRIIKGPRGPFIAMPCRKLTDFCPICSGKNALRAKFCNECGGPLNPDRIERDPQGRTLRGLLGVGEVRIGKSTLRNYSYSFRTSHPVSGFNFPD